MRKLHFICFLFYVWRAMNRAPYRVRYDGCLERAKTHSYNRQKYMYTSTQCIYSRTVLLYWLYFIHKYCLVMLLSSPIFQNKPTIFCNTNISKYSFTQTSIHICVKHSFPQLNDPADAITHTFYVHIQVNAENANTHIHRSGATLNQAVYIHIILLCFHK